jgi:hypothetical protein
MKKAHKIDPVESAPTLQYTARGSVPSTLLSLQDGSPLPPTVSHLMYHPFNTSVGAYYLVLYIRILTQADSEGQSPMLLRCGDQGGKNVVARHQAQWQSGTSRHAQVILNDSVGTVERITADVAWIHPVTSQSVAHRRDGRRCRLRRKQNMPCKVLRTGISFAGGTCGPTMQRACLYWRLLGGGSCRAPIRRSESGRCPTGPFATRVKILATRSRNAQASGRVDAPSVNANMCIVY